MKEIFTYVPPGAPFSPGLSLEFPLETQYYNAPFAVMLANSIGYLDPLLARLKAVTDIKELESFERQFLADSWGKRRPGGIRLVNKHRKWLCIAAHYLEQLARSEPGKGQRAEAERYAAKESPKKLAALKLIAEPRDLDTREVRRAVSFAKTVNYELWLSWWEIALQMGRKNKMEQLHRTY
jgi:hypothetical protein